MKQRTKDRTPKNRLPKRITLDYLRNSGLFYLERYPASVAHFRFIMAQKIHRSCKAHPDLQEQECLKLLEGLIPDFINKGYLNDTLYAQGLLTTLLQRGLSKRMIKQRLQQKGVLAPNLENSDLHSALRLMRRRKLGPFARAQDEKLLKRAFGALGRAGFDYDTCRKVIDTSRQHAEDLLSETDI